MSDDPDDRLRRAHVARSRDLVEARVVLGEAVAALTTELELRRQEVARAVHERDAALQERDIAVTENRALRERAERAEAHVAARPVGVARAPDDLAGALRARAGRIRRIVSRLLGSAR